MPTMRKLTAMATGTTATPLVGDQFEYLPFNAQVEIAVTADNSGVTATVFSGSDLLQQSAPVTQKAAPAVPVYPDDFMLVDVAQQGDRLSVQLANANAGTVNVNTIVRITPL